MTLVPAGHKPAGLRSWIRRNSDVLTLPSEFLRIQRRAEGPRASIDDANCNFFQSPGALSDPLKTRIDRFREGTQYSSPHLALRVSQGWFRDLERQRTRFTQ